MRGFSLGCYLLGDADEDLRMELSELRKYLAIETDLVLLHLSNESAVGLVAVFADSGVEAYDPELTVVILLVLAVSKGILASMDEGFLGETHLGGAAMAVALGTNQDVATALC